MTASQPCSIVPLAASHIEDISQIDKLCFVDPWLKRTFIEELSAPCTLNLVAVAPNKNTQTLGYCLCRVITDECTINRLAVYPDNQRCGIASHLLKALLHHADSRGARSCFIEVRAGNSAAQRLYEHHGFKRIGIRKAYYQIGNEDAILMQYVI